MKPNEVISSLPEWRTSQKPHDLMQRERRALMAMDIAWEALEECNSPETDWENGEIGVGNTFRHITKDALRRIAAIGGDAESFRELGETK